MKRAPIPAWWSSPARLLPASPQTLYDAHHVAWVWNIMGTVGIISAFGTWMYGKWILTLKKQDTK